MENQKNFLKVKFINIPDELIELDQWLVWEEELNRYGALTKVPRQAKNGFYASSMNPDTWCDYRTAKKASRNYDGIGFVPTKKSEIVGWDIDKCRDPDTGEITKPLAKKIIKRLNSYTEISPSGTGIRIFAKGDLFAGRQRSRVNGVEVYDSGQYLTVTGHHLKGTPKKVRIRRKATDEIYQLVFGYPRMEKLFP